MYNNNIREQKQHTLAGKKRIKNDPHALVYFFNQKQK